MGFVDLSYVLCLALLVSAFFLSQADHIDFFSLERCGSGGPPIKLNSISQRLTYIFYDAPFECKGLVASWEFFATRTGMFYATVWRKSESSKRYELIGKNLLAVEMTGPQEMEIPVFERIAVEVGDVIGLHYDLIQPELISITSGIVALETNINLGTRGLGRSLGKTGAFNLMDSQLPVGSLLPYTNSLEAFPALRARIAGPATSLRLTGGPSENEGRAEVYHDRTWGTACDRWFEERGWPFLFCLEIGFPDSAGVQYANEVGGSAIAPSNYPIHMHSPRCKPSQKISMFSCDMHPYGKCNHNSDVYLECAKKVGFIHSQDKNGGIPVHFEQGYWGNICDNRSPHAHETNRPHSWVTTFCLEMGYSGFKEIYNATQYIGNYVRQFPDTMKNPWCEGRFPDSLTQCTTGPEINGCNSDAYYVICDR